MRSLVCAVVSEHERLRDLLRGLLLLAARAEEGNAHAWQDLTELDLKRSLELHAQHERAEAARVFAPGDRFRRKLDALHEKQACAAILVRVAPDLQNALLHVGEIVTALAEEETELMAAQERLEPGKTA